jgi:hypothetical protein
MKLSELSDIELTKKFDECCKLLVKASKQKNKSAKERLQCDYLEIENELKRRNLA